MAPGRDILAEVRAAFGRVHDLLLSGYLNAEDVAAIEHVTRGLVEMRKAAGRADIDGPPEVES